jgi:uncharacterized coiled-coil protein SlyX
MNDSESIEQPASISQKIKDGLANSKEIVNEISRKLYKSDELNGKEKCELEEEIGKLSEKIKELENELLRKEKQITELNKKVERHETKFKEMESALQTGQIAFQFEKDLAKYIYPHDKKFSSRKIFTNMKKWLEDKKDTEQGHKADERWKALKEEFDWSSEHEEVFFRLLKFRRTFAHPDLGSAQFPIPDEFSDEEKRCIKVLNDMMERVSALLQQQ